MACPVTFTERGIYKHGMAQSPLTPQHPMYAFILPFDFSARCIARIVWKTLMVRDKRHVSDVGEMIAECMKHQQIATADGRCLGFYRWPYFSFIIASCRTVISTDCSSCYIKHCLRCHRPVKQVFIGLIIVLWSVNGLAKGSCFR